MSMDSYVFGKHMIPFTGIVEKRSDDNLKVGRMKVRALHYHTADKSLLPTELLPDAYPVLPLSGMLWSTPIEGDTVFGFFTDTSLQTMLVIGKIPAAQQHEVTSSEGDGFKDARSESELSSFPRQTFQSFTYSTSGINVSEMEKALRYPPHGIIGSSVPFSSRNEGNFPTQISPKTRASQASSTRYATATGETWFERPTEYAAVYPFNHSYESESLHVMEFDDTPGSERVNIRHRLGSGWEIFPDGSFVQKIVRDNYTVILGDNKIGITGKSDVHIKGDHTLLVEGNLTQHVSGDYNLSVGGNMSTKVGGKEVKNIAEDSFVSIDGDSVQKITKTLYLKTNKLQLNPSSAPDVESIIDFDLPALPDETLSFENQKKLIEAVGSPIAPTDDKDESPQADLSGEKVVTEAQPTPLTCPVVEDSTKNFSNGDTRYRMQLSKFYQLADMSIRCVYPHHICEQLGLSQDEIVCNLSYLCMNTLDEISAQFPGARINCGFRKEQNGKSQHEKGEAVDLQWPSIKVGSLNKYMEIAKWIEQNVPFDQLILEHGNTIWLHVSLKRKGSNRKEVLTMKDGAYYAGLNLFGRS